MRWQALAGAGLEGHGLWELSREEWIEQYSGDKGPGEDDP
jgi:hypothetical protein